MLPEKNNAVDGIDCAKKYASIVTIFQNKKGITSVLILLFTFVLYFSKDHVNPKKNRYPEIIKKSGTAILANPPEIKSCINVEVKPIWSTSALLFFIFMLEPYA